MNKIIIIPNPAKDKELAVTARVAEKLSSLGFCPYIENRYSKNVAAAAYKDLPNDADLIVVIGGDGSVIDASRIALQLDIPLLGVNLGKVGYLNEIEPNELESLSKIFTGEYKIVTRMLLGVTVTENENDIPFERYAVNDVVISNQEYMGISDFVVYSKDGGVRYRADGAVFSTPQGSTAYSLSAGGPIVSHDAGAIILTPIAPHSFFNRTIVFSENEVIKVKNTSNKALNVSLDGRLVYKLNSGDKISVKASDKKLKVMTFENNNMFSNLFSKMQILEDII